MTGGHAGEPTLDEVQRQFPEWHCARGNNGLFYAQHSMIGTQVVGEDPLDLRDQIKTAERRHAYDQHEPDATMPGQAGVS